MWKSEISKFSFDYFTLKNWIKIKDKNKIKVKEYETNKFSILVGVGIFIDIKY